MEREREEMTLLQVRQSWKPSNFDILQLKRELLAGVGGLGESVEEEEEED